MTLRNTIYLLPGFILILLLSACSSNIPPNIRQAVKAAPELPQVRASADAYLSQRIRWGGIILSTENIQNASRMTIVTFPLDDSGRPEVFNQSQGRFIAVVDDFLEPLVYSRDREITVVGRLVGTEAVNVGEYNYDHPVVAADEFYLWPAKPEATDYNPPYYRPYYQPYYPFYPWPYFHHPFPYYKRY